MKIKKKLIFFLLPPFILPAPSFSIAPYSFSSRGRWEKDHPWSRHNLLSLRCLWRESSKNHSWITVGVGIFAV